MQLTGGYVNWLRDNAKMMSGIEFSDDAKRQCVNYGKFVAFMRSRPAEDKRSSEKAERELAARLVSQHVRLARCLALVLNRPTVDDKVMRRVKRVALDTARGILLDITRQLFHTGAKGMERNGIHLHVNCTQGELDKLLRFMRDIGVTMLYSPGDGRRVWRLTTEMYALYRKVHE
jgi:hypothetical protein